MVQRKPDAERSKRSGSSKRLRTRQVSVRLTEAEYALVAAVAARAGKTHARVLRETFMLAEAALAERVRQRREGSSGG
jgi:hypothetical protein